ncbi:MAG: MraY family glycosyltransferase [Pseudomonadota bacterium]
MLAFFTLIVSMFIAMALIPPLMKSAARLSFVDIPDERKIHSTPKPRIGGVAMVAGAVTPMVLWIDHTQQVLALLFGIAVILVFGVWDDRRDLGYQIKFVGQLAAVLIVVLLGDIVIHFVPLFGIEPVPQFVAIPLTIFALLGVTNAVNLADGLDGLASGLTFLSFAAIGILGYIAGDETLLLVALAVMGSIIGFLRYNTHPAQIFMGDSGSQFLGYTVGVLTIMLSQQTNQTMSPAMPLLILGLPLIDTFMVMGQRIAAKRSPFKPDKNHIHHRLMAVGFDHYECVIFIYSVQTVLVSLGFLLRYQSDVLLLGIFSFVLIATVIGFSFAERYQWRAHIDDEAAERAPLVRFVNKLRRSAVLVRYPVLFAAVSIPLYAAYAIVATARFPVDAQLMAGALLVVALAFLLVRRGRQGFGIVERLILYVTITSVTYYWCSSGAAAPVPAFIEDLYFAILGVILLVAYRFSRGRVYEVTPTDFLIIFVALLVPTLGGAFLPYPFLGEVAIKTLVMFYAVELIVALAGAHLLLMRGVVCVVLSLFVLRAGFIGM